MTTRLGTIALGLFSFLLGALPSPAWSIIQFDSATVTITHDSGGVNAGVYHAPAGSTSMPLHTMGNYPDGSYTQAAVGEMSPLATPIDGAFISVGPGTGISQLEGNDHDNRPMTVSKLIVEYEYRFKVLTELVDSFTFTFNPGLVVPIHSVAMGADDTAEFHLTVDIFGDAVDGDNGQGVPDLAIDFLNFGEGVKDEILTATGNFMYITSGPFGQPPFTFTVKGLMTFFVSDPGAEASIFTVGQSLLSLAPPPAPEPATLSVVAAGLLATLGGASMRRRTAEGSALDSGSRSS